MFFLLFPIILQAQTEYLGTVIIDTVVYQWGDTFDKLADFLERNQIEKTTDGKKVLFIPDRQVFKKIKRKAMIVDGVLVAFTYDDENDVLVIEHPETWLFEYSLKDKIKDEPKKYDTDTYSDLKPKNLEQKIKDKLKKIKP